MKPARIRAQPVQGRRTRATDSTSKHFQSRATPIGGQSVIKTLLGGNTPMPPYWKAIRAAREDLTDWVIHRTTYQFTPGEKYLRTFETLKLILQSGYLKPSF